MARGIGEGWGGWGGGGLGEKVRSGVQYDFPDSQNVALALQ